MDVDLGKTVEDYAAHRAGSRRLESFTYVTAVNYGHADWRGRIRAPAGVGGSLSEREVEVFDSALSAMLKRRYSEDPLAVPNRVFVAFARAA